MSVVLFTKRFGVQPRVVALLRQQLPPEVGLWVGGAWASANRRRLPKGVLPVVNDAQVNAGLARWRAAHG